MAQDPKNCDPSPGEQDTTTMHSTPPRATGANDTRLNINSSKLNIKSWKFFASFLSFQTNVALTNDSTGKEDITASHSALVADDTKHNLDIDSSNSVATSVAIQDSSTFTASMFSSRKRARSCDPPAQHLVKRLRASFDMMASPGRAFKEVARVDFKDTPTLQHTSNATFDESSIKKPVSARKRARSCEPKPPAQRPIKKLRSSFGMASSGTAFAQVKEVDFGNIPCLQDTPNVTLEESSAENTKSTKKRARSCEAPTQRLAKTPRTSFYRYPGRAGSEGAQVDSSSTPGPQKPKATSNITLDKSSGDKTVTKKRGSSCEPPTQRLAKAPRISFSDSPAHDISDIIQMKPNDAENAESPTTINKHDPDPASPEQTVLDGDLVHTNDEGKPLDTPHPDQSCLEGNQESSSDTLFAQQPLDAATPENEASTSTQSLPTSTTGQLPNKTSSTTITKKALFKKSLTSFPLEEPRIGSRPTITWNAALSKTPRLTHPQRIRKAFSRIKKALDLRRFPPEIRENIFALCIDLDKNSKTSPVLIQALRGDKLLYAEALDCFYRLNTFIVCRDTLETWERLRVNCKRKKGLQVLKMIRKVNVIAPAADLQVRFNIIPKIFEKIGYNHVDTLNFTIYNLDELIKHVPPVLNGFPNLKFLGIWIPSLTVDGENEVVAMKILKGMGDIGKALGVEARMSWVATGMCEHWGWTAAKGRVLSASAKAIKKFYEISTMNKTRSQSEGSGRLLGRRVSSGQSSGNAV